MGALDTLGGKDLERAPIGPGDHRQHQGTNHKDPIPIEQQKQAQTASSVLNRLHLSSLQSVISNYP